MSRRRKLWWPIWRTSSLCSWVRRLWSSSSCCACSTFRATATWARQFSSPSFKACAACHTVISSLFIFFFYFFLFFVSSGRYLVLFHRFANGDVTQPQYAKTIRKFAPIVTYLSIVSISSCCCCCCCCCCFRFPCFQFVRRRDQRHPPGPGQLLSKPVAQRSVVADGGHARLPTLRLLLSAADVRRRVAAQHFRPGVGYGPARSLLGCGYQLRLDLRSPGAQHRRHPCTKVHRLIWLIGCLISTHIIFFNPFFCRCFI